MLIDLLRSASQTRPDLAMPSFYESPVVPSTYAPNVSRRRLLQIGSLGLMGVHLPQLLAADERAAKSGIRPRADACIVIFLNGGPSHLDMWDMKPDAPVEIRGEFQSIRSSAPGIRLCEHLPKLARQMHHATLVRSMHHNVNNSHALAVYTAMTGHDRGDVNRIVGASAEDQPSPGCVLTKLRPPKNKAVPYVSLPYKTKEGASGPPQPGFVGGFIGQGYDPLWVLSDPNAPNFSVDALTLNRQLTASRVKDRTALLEKLDTQRKIVEVDRTMRATNRFQHRALDMLTSRDAQQAFRIHEESDKTRSSYGRNIYGQSVLLARRLIEAGTRVVNISWAPDANATWDTHAGNFNKLKNPLLPQFDAACSSLLADLHERGLLERTLVAVMGDFGRSPKVNSNQGGRDHWNSCYTILLAGGGIRGGHVFGASDRTGSLPAVSPVTPGDVIATIYNRLGIDHRHHLYDALDRPLRIVPEGKVLRGLLV